jgi:ABC-type Zn uptake system ZnuABC Zn-binding protein ZnuA
MIPTRRQADDGADFQVVTTVAPITSIAANVLGECATITGIVPEGTNSHTFEPPPSAAEVMTTADVVFINGLQLEEPTKELALANVADGVEVIELGDRTIDPEQYKYDFSFPEDGGKPNPHLWTDPTLVKVYADIIRETVAAELPDCADDINANYDEFVTLVDEFDAAIREAFDTIPEDQRKLVTYHDAYAYFADTYGWNVIGAVQPADFGDPTPADVVNLIEQIESEQVPAIFGSEVFPSPILEQIAQETGAEYVDDLRDDDLPGATRGRRPLVARADEVQLHHDDRGAGRRRQCAARLRSPRRRHRQRGVPAVSRCPVMLRWGSRPTRRRRRLIVVDRLTVNYGGGPPVLIDVDLTVESGDLIGIVGPSGSGKSTLLSAMLGTVSPVSGSVRRSPVSRSGSFRRSSRSTGTSR